MNSCQRCGARGIIKAHAASFSGHSRGSAAGLGKAFFEMTARLGTQDKTRSPVTLNGRDKKAIRLI